MGFLIDRAVFLPFCSGWINSYIYNKRMKMRNFLLLLIELYLEK